MELLRSARLVLSFFICFVRIGVSSMTVTATQKSACGNWVPYGNEKCLHIVDSAIFQTNQEAGIVCQSLADVMDLDDVPRVVTVRTETEQKALQRFLFEEIGILEPVWLGLDRGDNGVFKWNNGAELQFENLAKQNVSDADRPCVQMESGQGIYPMGQWVRVNCRKRNVVVCEKIQVWTAAKLQNNFMNLKSQVEKQKGTELQTTIPKEKVPGDSIQTDSCGDWVPFKDETCVKLITGGGTKTKIDAEFVCRSLMKTDKEEVAKLVVINTEEKQKFLQTLLFEKQSIFDNVWLGLEVSQNNIFRWNDGTQLHYTNWANQEAVHEEQNCVQMVTGENVYKSGQWAKTNCKKRNAVVCEKTQTWTTTRLQNILLALKLQMERNQKEWNEKNMASKQEAQQTLKAFKLETERMLNAVKQEAERKINDVKQDAEKKINLNKQDADGKINTIKQDAERKINVNTQEMDRRINNVKQEAERSISAGKQEAEKKIKEAENKIIVFKVEADKKIDNLIKNPVPVGFIYTQLPGQDPPTKIWPQTSWTDVSGSYAGLFFRVKGGSAAAFGSTQEDSSPRLAYVQAKYENDNGGPFSATVPSNGEWSGYIFTGDPGGRKDINIRFQLSKGEVRPRNKAVVIWRRN